MKKIRRLFGLSATCCVALAAMLTACKDEIYRTVGGNRVAARFSSLVADDTRLSDTSWESGDQIGIYAYDSEGVLADATNDNARFVINPENNGCTVANEDSIVWLQKGETYSVVAYYPFSKTFSSVDNPSMPTVLVQNVSTIAVGDKPGAEQQLATPMPIYIISNWADQSDLASLDLLWCKQEGVSADDPDVTLSLAHQFCRVQLNITIDTELSSLTADSLAGMKVLLAGKNFPAFFNLQSGEMSFGPESEDSIAFNIQRQEGATTAKASAIIVPDTENSNTEGRTITVQLPADNNRKYVIEIPDEIVFQSGKLYTWNVTFNTGADLSTNSFYVSATGLDSNDGKRDSPLASFEGAVAKMNDPQADYTIYVDGTLTQYQNLYGALSPSVAQSVTIMGANGIDPETNAPKDSIKLSGSGASVLLVETDVPLTLSNIVLTGGNSNNNGGGILINHYQAKVTLADGAIITGNTTAENGGGIYMVDGASLVMFGGRIENNTAGDVDTYEYGTGNGGGIYAEENRIYIFGNSVIASNKALGDGGGIYLDGYHNGYLQLGEDASIINNEANGSGGGIAVPRSATVKMYDNATIHANTAGTESDQQGDNVGGGVCLGGDSDFGGASFYMWGGTISGNKVLYSGGEWNNAVCMWGTSSRHSTFAMGGSAVVASDNSVYLGTAPLDIIAPLTGTSPVATLESDSWSNGMQAIEMGTILDDATGVYEEVTTTTVAAEYTKFAISGGDGSINQQGVYVSDIDIDAIVSQITSMTESGTVVASGYAHDPDAAIERIKEALETLATNRQDVFVTLDMSGVLGMTSIGNFAFENCSALAGITIPSGVTSFGEAAFIDCTGLTSIEIPSSVTSIGVSAFNGCYGLTSIEIPSSVTEIGIGAFQGCSGLTSIEIPSGVTSISGDAFGGCRGLTSITIPSGVTSIGSYAFAGCYGLTSITIPSSVTSISFLVFDQCYDLTTVYYTGSEADRDNMTIEDDVITGSGVTWVYANGYGFVDLSLPSGIRWATCNIGADSPSGFGGAYAWGETTTKTDFSWGTYSLCEGTSSSFTKYVIKASHGAVVDNKTVLESGDDAAFVNWGGSWRMPTIAEYQELQDNCTSEATTLNGVSGYVFTGPNGNSIFMPMNDTGGGSYWTSSLLSDNDQIAWMFHLNTGLVTTEMQSYRYSGLSVRAVLAP